MNKVFKDVNGTHIAEGDFIQVCVFFVSPYNPDDDHHFRGVINYEKSGFPIFKISEMMSRHTDGKWLPLDWRCGLDRDLIQLDGTIRISLLQLCEMSGNLGEYNPENVEIIKYNSTLLN